MADRKRAVADAEATTTVAGADWTGRDISGQTHTRLLFDDLDLSEVENTGAVFTECTFRRARFNVSAHRDAAFVNCTFKGCTFFDTRFTECKMVGSTFDRCTFDVTRVVGGNWSFVALPGADLRRASFSGVRLREADLTGARCQGASLRDCDLAGASLRGATLTGCDLRGSDLGALDPQHTPLSGAIVTYEQALVIAAALGLDIRAE